MRHLPARHALAILLLLASTCARAQGGPPLITDDPGTPGDGHWEVNLAALGSRSDQRWDVDAFDADINYGLGEHIQLKLDIPWSYTQETGQAWKSGLGTVNAGVKWRFIDQEDSGFSMSTYPQYLSAWSSASKHRGIASADAQFYMPLEFSTAAGGFEFASEVGRNFIEREADQWQAGIVAEHPCGGAVECLVEVHQTWQHQ